jgi:hypothetical protein
LGYHEFLILDYPGCAARRRPWALELNTFGVIADWLPLSKRQKLFVSHPLDRFLDSISSCFTPQVAERIAGLQLDPELLARIEQLAQKANEGLLTPEEDEEYKDYVDGGDMLALIQAKARRFLKQHGE